MEKNQRGKMVLLLFVITIFIPMFFPSTHVVSHSITTSIQSEYSAAQSYYHTHRYLSTNKKHMIVSENATKTEPPEQFRPFGEQEFSKEKYHSLLQENSIENETHSVSKFPYHRFDVKVGNDIHPSDMLSLHWEGKSLSGRQVTMYVWNLDKKKWVAVDQKIADSSAFELNGTILADEYVENQKVSVIVQDQIFTLTKSYDYSFVWLSDTQYYAQDYPAIFKSITEWIAQNKDVMNIKYLFHTGDIVNKGDDEKQWLNASAHMNTLDVAKIPYGVLPGNHDEGKQLEYYTRYFGKSRFENKRYYGDSYENNRGHYDLISVDGKDYVFVYMGWDVEEKDIVWMNEVLERYSDRTAILSLHRYLEKNGKRSREGNAIYEKVVVPNQNVVAVLCGHYHGSSLKVDEIDDNQDGSIDRTVYQILADYQKAPNGGDGFIRLLHIDKETNTIDVQTYSPYVNQYSYYDPMKHPNKDQFTMNIDLQQSKKMISTTTFELNVYKKIDGYKVAKLTVN
ncbi:metallophosphoesterase [Metabacillus litoralis]|uniref:metallophosphoesterase n=1 Tax=Metabacillus litoralis TaxID=152268 RepID=UPI001CFDA461|nr:metallophosphoesterase [Metabacillus litoralis]